MVGKDSSVETPWQMALPALRKLSVELDAGIAALARQDLKAFEKHVAAQEELCEVLRAAGVVPAQSNTRPGAVSTFALMRPENAHWDVLQHLDRQKRVYSALLRRARRFAQVISTLYQSRTGYSAEGRLPLPSSTWSSEA